MRAVPERVEILVVGAGVMGLATARALARAGREVVVAEQFRVGHTRGSSHGSARIFRLSYADPAYVELARRALPLWRELEREAGEPLLTTTGCIDLGLDVAERGRIFESSGLEYEVLDAADVERRHSVSAGGHAQVLFQPDAGFLHAERALHAFRRSAEAAGATVIEDARVDALDEASGRVTARAATRTLTARAIVVTAGAWLAGIVDRLGIAPPVTPTRETVAYFETDGRIAPPLIDWAELPGRAHDAPQAAYSLPTPEGRLKAGLHRAGPPIHPDNSGPADPAALERIADWVARHHPTLDPKPVASETCLYTNTADESFILERHGRVVVGSPCSGHGFKFAPVVGEHLARLAIEASRSA